MTEETKQRAFEKLDDLPAQDRLPREVPRLLRAAGRPRRPARQRRRRRRRSRPTGSWPRSARRSTATSGSCCRRPSTPTTTPAPTRSASRRASCRSRSSPPTPTRPRTTAASARSSATRSATASTTRARSTTARGNLNDWWTADDKAAFEVKSQALIEQYDGFEPRALPGEHVNGALTVGENIGDLGGLTIAHKAYLIAARPAASAVTTEDRQRLFLNWAYCWRTKRRKEQEHAVPHHRPAQPAGVPRQHRAQPRRVPRGVRDRARRRALARPGGPRPDLVRPAPAEREGHGSTAAARRSPGLDGSARPSGRTLAEAGLWMHDPALSAPAGRQAGMPPPPRPTYAQRAEAAPAGARRAATTPVLATTSGRRSRRWRSTGGGRWWCSAPAGASRRSTSSPPCCCAQQGAGPTVIVSPLLALMRNQIAAAERAGIRAVTINSTNIEEWEPIHDADRGRRGRRAAGHPRAAQQPRLPRRGAAPAGRDLRACWWSTRRTASPTGATTSGPTTAGSARCSPTCPTASRCWPPPPPPTPGSPPTSPSSSAPTSWCCAARSTASRCGSGWSGSRPPSSGWPGWPTTSPSSPGSGIVYCLTVAATQEVADYLRSRGHDVAAYSGQTETTERLALEDDLLAGRVKALVATSALGMGFDADARLRRQPRRAAVAGRLLPAGRPRRPRHRRRRTVVLLPAIEDRDIWAYFASLAFPREELVRQTLDVLADEGRPAEHRRPRDPRRAQPHPPRDDAQGARRRRRRTPRPGRLGAPPASRGPTTPSATRRVAEAREREQQAMLDYLDTDRCRMRFLRDQLDDPRRRRRLRPLRQLRRPDARRADVSAAAVERRRRAAGPARAWSSSRARCGRPRSPPSGSTSRARSPTPPRRAGRSPGSPTSATARRCASCSAPATADGPVPVPLVERRASRSSATGSPPSTRSSSSSPRRRPTLTARPRRRPVPLPAGAGRRPLAIVDPHVAPGQGAIELRPAGGGGVPAVRLAGPTSRPLDGAGSCWSTTWSVTGWTLTLAARACARAGATEVLPLTLAGRRA